MPELPEVEHVRRSLEPLLLGATVTNAQLRRMDVVRTSGRVRQHDLLKGATIDAVARHGKDLAIIATDGRTLGVHLGMSGWLSWTDMEATRRNGCAKLDHVHCIWRTNGPNGSGVLRFRDPRRFGGLWLFKSPDDWRNTKLARRGPDALAITPAHLMAALTNSRRPIKAALLDQSVLAGVGNIYADEALFAAQIHPATPAHRVARNEVLARTLRNELRRILRRAIRSGGSTVRSYRDVGGNAGAFSRWHLVYGRTGEPCLRCSCPLKSMQLAQRTTVFCPHCQLRRARPKRQATVAALSGNEEEIN